MYKLLSKMKKIIIIGLFYLLLSSCSKILLRSIINLSTVEKKHVVSSLRKVNSDSRIKLFDSDSLKVDCVLQFNSYDLPSKTILDSTNIGHNLKLFLRGSNHYEKNVLVSEIVFSLCSLNNNIKNESIVKSVKVKDSIYSFLNEIDNQKLINKDLIIKKSMFNENLLIIDFIPNYINESDIFILKTRMKIHIDSSNIQINQSDTLYKFNDIQKWGNIHLH
jgi:hypothetical protein